MSNSLEEILSQTYIITCVEMCILSREPFKKTTRARDTHCNVCVQRWLHFKRTFRVCRHTAGSDISIDFSQGSNEAGWDGKLALLKV